MNAKRIIDIFKHVSLKHVKTPLGRWNLNNYSETTLKIKYATEDNCGISCHYYKNTTQIEENKELDNLYIYSMGYESTH